MEGALDTIGLFLFVAQFAIWNADILVWDLNLLISTGEAECRSAGRGL